MFTVVILRRSEMLHIYFEGGIFVISFRNNVLEDDLWQ